MKFKWFETETWTQELIESWSLWLLDKQDAPLRSFGTLYKADKGYVILERGKEHQPLVLQDDLSLEDAQRAAKLLLLSGQGEGLNAGVGGGR